MAIDERASCPVHAHFDPLQPAFLADPFAVLASLRGEAPVFYAPSIDHFVVTRYADIEAVFLDHESYSAAATQRPVAPLAPEAVEILSGGGIASQPSMVSLDPPAHTRLRSPTVRAFTPRRVASMEPRIRDIVRGLLDAIVPGEPFDLVACLSLPLPTTIILGFLGIPERDQGRFREWCRARTTLLWGRSTPDEQVRLARNLAEYRGYLRGHVARTAQHRDDSFTSALLSIHDADPTSLTHDEIVTIIFGLTLAGHETTNYLIGNSVYRLLEEPSRWDEVVADPSLVPRIIEETLRFDPPVHAWRRVTTRPVMLGGVDLPKGAMLLLWIAASGRDPSVFPTPDSFDLHRSDSTGHLAFGRGIHFCLGSALGKLEARNAIESLVHRFPTLRLVEGQTIPFPTNIAHRGPLSLWVQAT